MRPLTILLALALFAVGAASGAADRSATTYRAVGASATARLTYTLAGANSRSTGYVDQKAVLARPIAGRSHGALLARGGSVRFPVTITTTERATVSERSSPTAPYVEQRCGNTARRKATGGLTFKRLGATRVQVSWAFPHPRTRACPGPGATPAAVRGKAVRVFPAGRFNAARVTLILSGSARFRQGSTTGSYRWQATVTLGRV